MGKVLLLTLSFGLPSLVEVALHLEDRKVGYHLLGWGEEWALLEVKRDMSRELLSRLGGFYRLGEVLATLPLAEALEGEALAGRLEPQAFYGWVEDKASWAVNVYPSTHPQAQAIRRALVEFFKERLREEGVRKARLRSGTKGSELPSYEFHRLAFEVLAVVEGERVHLAKTLGVVDHQGFRHRDLGRPHQDPRVTTPPRVARLLVNLAGGGPGVRLLDPFCGLGTILMEALLLGAEVYGLDRDPAMVAGARENIRWLAAERGIRPVVEHHIRVGDARRLPQLVRGSYDAIATEPILLPPLERPPRQTSALKMLEDALRVYRAALPAMRAVLKPHGRLVLVVPRVRVRGGRELSFPPRAIIEAEGFRPLLPRGLKGIRQPLDLPGMGPAQRVLRSIYLLERA